MCSLIFFLNVASQKLKPIFLVLFPPLLRGFRDQGQPGQFRSKAVKLLTGTIRSLSINEVGVLVKDERTIKRKWQKSNVESKPRNQNSWSVKSDILVFKTCALTVFSNIVTGYQACPKGGPWRGGFWAGLFLNYLQIDFGKIIYLIKAFIIILYEVVIIDSTMNLAHYLGDTS